ncbi:MAG: sensor histidine kinase [Lachnospiraceae bacterium]
MSDVLYYLMVYVIEASILGLYCHRIFSCRVGRLAGAVILYGCYICLVPAALLTNPLVNGLLFFIVNCLIMIVVYNSKIPVAVFHSVFLTALMGICELVVVSLVPFLVIRNYREVDELYGSGNLYVVLSKLLYVITSQIVANVMSKKDKRQESARGTSFLSIIICISACIMLALNMLCLNAEFTKQNRYLVSICAVLLLLVIIITYALQQYIQENSYEYSRLQMQLQRESDESEYYKMLIKRDEEQHMLIHDIKNHLNTIAILSEQNNTDAINQYVRNIMNSNIYSNYTKISDNNVVNIILSRYMKMCEEENINFTTDIRNGVLKRVCDEDWTTLLCNLLDNAIEAARVVNNGIIDLSITKVDSSDSILISIINSCSEKPFSPDGRLRTKKKDKKTHGYGLKSINRIVKKYNGTIQQYYDEKLCDFHTIISIL